MQSQIQLFRTPKLIRRNPIASALTASALALMALNSPAISRSLEQNSQQRESMSQANQALQTLQVNEQHRAELAIVANSRYDKGCEMVYSTANPKTYTAINPDEPVLDGSSGGYMPAGVTLCDAFGNTAVIVDKFFPELNQTLPVVGEFASTQDKEIVKRAMNPDKATRPVATQN